MMFLDNDGKSPLRLLHLYVHSEKSKHEWSESRYKGEELDWSSAHCEIK